MVWIRKFLTVLLTSWSMTFVTAVVPQLQLADSLTGSSVVYAQTTETVKTEKVKGGMLSKILNQIIIIAFAASGTFLASCALGQGPFALDMVFAGLGAVTFLIGEIAAHMKAKKALKEIQEGSEFNTFKRADGSYDDSQKEMFKKQKTSYEKVASAGSVKAKFRYAAAAMLGIAALMHVEIIMSSLGVAELWKKLTAADGILAKCVAVSAEASTAKIAAAAAAGIAGAGILGYFAGFGAAIGLLLLFIPTVNGWIAKATLSSSRWITWTSLSVVAVASGVMANKEASRAQSNADKLQAIIDKMSAGQQGSLASSSGNRSVQGAGGTIAGINSSASTVARTSSLDLGANTGCLLKDPSTGICKSFTKTVDASGQLVNFPSNVQTAASAATNFGDAAQRSNSLSSGSLDNLDTVAGQQSSIIRQVKALEKKLNEKRVAQGKKAVNFDAARRNKLEELKNKIKGVLKKEGKTANQVSAAFGAALNTAPGESILDKSIRKGTDKNNLTTTVETEQSKGLKRRGGNSDIFGDLVGDTSLDQKTPESVQVENPQDLSQIDGEFAQNDIVTNKDASIFKVISVRYFKSGIPRILKSIKEEKAIKEKRKEQRNAK